MLNLRTKAENRQCLYPAALQKLRPGIQQLHFPIVDQSVADDQLVRPTSGPRPGVPSLAVGFRQRVYGLRVGCAQSR